MKPELQSKMEVPDYGSSLPSTVPSSRVRVQYKKNQYIEVPEYGSRFPSTDFDMKPELQSKMESSVYVWIAVRTMSQMRPSQNNLLPGSFMLWTPYG